MAERGELPHFLTAIHKRFHTPHAAIILTATLMAALTLSGTFLYAVTISTIARLVIYGTTCGALPVLRRRVAAPAAAFRAPAGLPLSLLTLALATWLVVNTSWREVRDTAIAAAIGLAVYALSRRSASSSAAR
jgi:APA family basic amino acid/polyamine antiporter